LDIKANDPGTVLPGHARLHSKLLSLLRRAPRTLQLTLHQDSDTQPNTTASSVAGDAPADGRKKRAEALNMRKSIYGKKHDRLGASKVRGEVGASRP
jgi:hypothetical protein